MNRDRTLVVDVSLVAAVSIIGVIAIGALLFDLPREVELASVIGLTLVGIGAMTSRLITRPDHLRAMQSHQILEIANHSLTYLRRGLDEETANAVCRLALQETEAAAVAITDRERVLGFAGLGEDHHTTGGPIITRATMDAIEKNVHRVLETREEIGCPRKDCLLQAAIVVPLRIRGEAVGTLKFYYTTPRLLNETQVTMAEGLAQLLSTQLELSELDRQTELATRMELKALQAQIHPHFLFNTINTIASFIRTDPNEARRLLREFAMFYRRTLETGDDLVPLSQEIDYTERYLGFEKARFGDRIDITEEIDPSRLDLRVPAFILQPIVENAVQHGMRPDGVLHIRIESCDEPGDIVCITVADDGVGIPADDLPRVLEQGFGRGLGIALKNVHDRLTGYFGAGSGLSVESERGQGTRVTLRIAVPAKTAEGDHAQSARSR